MAQGLRGKVPGLMLGAVAEITAKLAIAALDEDHDGALSRDEIDSIATDVKAEMAKYPPPAKSTKKTPKP